MWWWSKNNRLDEIIPPSKEIEIKSLDFIENKMLDFKNLYLNITDKIKKMKGEFRQDETLDSWKQLFSYNENEILSSITLRARVSSGTYIRTLIQDIAEYYNTKAISIDINRTNLHF